jgi:hypothetical protein
MSEKKLTSLKLDEELFEAFKIECIKRKFTLQKLTERCVHLYLKDEEFRKKVHNYKLD